ncbi:MAG: YbhB/YbcL family Raf kinase inhibitor-like protein [Candidatus Magasanikbacteria bacterium]|nr:YbhB/YbcL family Raf kinase inhibitor-like protein [Candidatus Magasanikbacteria bacterium]
MQLTSSAFVHNGFIPKEYSCDGSGAHPPLEWSGVPTEAKSLALIVDDPDAPAGLWTHWLLWNIDPKTFEIKAGEAPTGAVQGKTSSGENQWCPPCPPAGTHHYRFKLYALDSALALAPVSIQKELEAALQGQVLGQTELVGLYARQK